MTKLANCKITNVTYKVTKDGRDYCEILFENNGEISKGILWKSVIDTIEPKSLREGNCVIIDSSSFSSQYNSHQVANVILISQGKIGLNEEEQEELYKKVEGYLEKVTDESLREFVHKYLTKYKSKFMTSPAATSHHHNYVGGLLEHTYECLTIAEQMSHILPGNVDTSNLIAACIMHDFGKIFEYSIDLETGVASYNKDFIEDWISHTQWGFCICMCKGFKKVAKIIAGHHGKIAWGALIDIDLDNKNSELTIMHYADNLSAKFGKISVASLGE